MPAGGSNQHLIEAIETIGERVASLVRKEAAATTY
jgi:hypothetical protein